MADLVIVSPLFFGDVGGASVYYQQLTRHLEARGHRVAVVSDREPGRRDGAFYGLFPARSARSKVFGRDHVAYAIQNLAYLALPVIVRRERPRALLVHTAFHHQPGLFDGVLRSLAGWARRSGVRIVADVRDRLLAPRKIGVLATYDAVIACGENVRRHLIDAGADPLRVHALPILQEPIAADPDAGRAIAGELGAGGSPFFLYAGLIKETKDVDLLLRAFIDHVRPHRPELSFVLVGPIKTWRRDLREALRAPGVVWAGIRPRADVLALMSAAAAVVNVSRQESVSRTSLEALALQRPVLLPPQTPEFDRHCAPFVVRRHDPAAIAEQILEIIDRAASPDYPIADHSPERVLPRYQQLLFSELPFHAARPERS